LKILWTEELGAGYYPWGHKRVRQDFTFTFIYIYIYICMLSHSVVSDFL